MSALIGNVPHAELSEETLPHEFMALRNIWCAVLRTWVQDAMKAHRAICRGQSPGTDERHALSMIQRKERGFVGLCEVLDLDPEYVRSHVVEQDMRREA